MQPSAWVFMVAVWAAILAITVFSFWKLLTSERLLSPEDGPEPSQVDAGKAPASHLAGTTGPSRDITE